ncbi:MAG: hypothetical protein AAGD25_07815 [Cyanobacteria bacterium P01_F01_bin.150]
MVYIAEFAVLGTMELADEILICSDSKEDAHLFALHYASNWGVDLHSLRVATDQYIKAAKNYKYSIPKQLKTPQSTFHRLSRLPA